MLTLHTVFEALTSKAMVCAIAALMAGSLAISTATSSAFAAGLIL